MSSFPLVTAQSQPPYSTVGQTSASSTLCPLSLSSSAPRELAGRAEILAPNTFIQRLQEIRERTYPVKGQTSVLIVGPTGAGKSTLMNALCNKKLKKTSDRIDCEDPVSIIGHGHNSCTEIPIAVATSGFTFCDCAGFFDNRGPLHEVMNAVTLSQIARSSQSVQCIVLCLEYATIISVRSHDMNKTLEDVQKFLGEKVSFDSVFLLITKAPLPLRQSPEQ